MRNFLKQALCLFAALSLVLACMPAEADVASAFKSLVTDGATEAINKPGQFNSQARNAFVGGGLDVRFPTREAPQIVNVTPFRFQAGCGGISFAFGGFSFISGDEIEQLIRSVAQNSIGMAVELVMTTLCGPCASVMQVMRNLALAASKNTLDSCRIATNLDKSILGSSVNPSDQSSNACGMIGSTFGLTSDPTAAMSQCQGIGASIDKATNWLNGAIAGLPNINAVGQNSLLCAAGAVCNTIWNLMAHTPLGPDTPENRAEKLLVMNVLGTNIMTGQTAAVAQTQAQNASAAASTGVLASQSSGSTSVSISSAPVSSTSGNLISSGSSVQPNAGEVSNEPTLGNVRGNTTSVDMDKVFKLFMCGLPGNTTTTGTMATAAVAWYCTTPADSSTGGQAFDMANVQIWDCLPQGGGTTDYTNCLSVSKQPISSTPLGTAQGYLPMVANLLQGGVDAVRQNSALDPDLIGLIQSMPVPVYQAINAAAVYPAAGNDLIGVMSVEVAELLTFENLKDIVTAAATFNDQVNLPATQIDRIYALLNGIRAGTDNRHAQLVSQMTIQAGLMEQIRQMNIAMQREVMPPELLSSHNYGISLATATGGSQ